MSVGTITVANRHFFDPDYTDSDTVVVKVNRPNPLGNPFEIRPGMTRVQAIAAFDEKLRRDLSSKYRTDAIYDEIMAIAEQCFAGKDIVLVCCCAPAPCHADSIKREVQRMVEVLCRAYTQRTWNY